MLPSYSPDFDFISLPPLPLSRRGVLGILGGAGVAMAASVTPAAASMAASSSQRRIDLTGLPREWVNLRRAELLDYTRYVVGLKLQYITTEQVIQAHAKSHGNVWNTLPPKAWWPRMAYTLRVVDRIAQYLRAPVKEILSAYRCPNYNAHCPGAKSGSWHQANMAVDVAFTVPPSTATSMSRNLRDRGLFKGGIGGYGTFTHIDTRGENINW
jgi:hypothetical protein